MTGAKPLQVQNHMRLGFAVQLGTARFLGTAGRVVRSRNLIEFGWVNFPLDRRAQATEAVVPHKGAEPAVSFYTHISDGYALFHSKVISASANEAAQVLDGLLHHGADPRIKEHHVGGDGSPTMYSRYVIFWAFDLCRASPTLQRAGRTFLTAWSPGLIGPLVAGKVDEQLVTSHWNDVLRLGASIRAGVVSASIKLERLGSYPRANGLALTLRKIGRVERTSFTLDWIDQPEQRRRATRELNNGKAEMP